MNYFINIMDVNISSMFIIYYFKYVVRACSVWKCRIRMSSRDSRRRRWRQCL